VIIDGRLADMTALRILFIGGTGIISSACAQSALAAGHRITILNRGTTALRSAPAGAEILRADVRDIASIQAAIGDREFDVVVDFVAYEPEHVRSDVDLFGGRTGQYVFISSASAYHKPPRYVPVTESTPLHNPYWQYSRNKIACEETLLRAYRETGFPVTIVRPSHTYDRTSVPILGGWTQIDRMRRGLEVVVQGDGTSLWTLTHHVDFAKGFVGLLGNSRTIGEAYTITGDDVLTWDQIFTLLGTAAGARPRLVHMASELIAALEPDWGPGLLGDKAHSMIFDNSKIRTVVPDYVATIPFEQGAREIISWRNEDPARQVVDDRVDATVERLLRRAR
jgi:nucleoside-diphosphate-sugar epimerase